jgi:hypothetical protein
MATAGYTSQVLIASLPSVALTDDTTSTSDSITYTTTVAAHRYLDKSVAVVVQAIFDEVQQVAITGSPAGGTFTLTFGAQTTAAINWNDPASTVQTRLQALSSIGAGNALVTGGPGPNTPYVVQFTGTMAKTNEALITLANNSLTGGTSPSVSITALADGSNTYTAITPTGTPPFTLFRANARIVFTQAIPGAVVRFHSGNYFPYAQIAEAASCEFDGKMATEDTTTFASATASSGAKSFTPTLLTGTLKYNSFWLNNARVASLVARDFLIVSFQTPPGNRYEGFCYAGDCNIKSDVGKVVTQDLVFNLTDEFFNS